MIIYSVLFVPKSIQAAIAVSGMTIVEPAIHFSHRERNRGGISAVRYSGPEE